MIDLQNGIVTNDSLPHKGLERLPAVSMEDPIFEGATSRQIWQLHSCESDYENHVVQALAAEFGDELSPREKQQFKWAVADAIKGELGGLARLASPKNRGVSLAFEQMLEMLGYKVITAIGDKSQPFNSMILINRTTGRGIRLKHRERVNGSDLFGFDAVRIDEHHKPVYGNGHDQIQGGKRELARRLKYSA